MKKLILALLAMLLVTACSSQPKDIYFNGSDGSHSGLKYDQSSKSLSVNQ